MTLDPEIIARDLGTAHSCGDINALVRLYTQLADIKEAAGEVDAACFFLTCLMIFQVWWDNKFTWLLDASDSRAEGDGSFFARFLRTEREFDRPFLFHEA